jgi:hypothetical protein
MEADRQKRPRGGQVKDPADRKRNNLTFRARDVLKDKLEETASKNGRSISGEIEVRLEMSFDWERAHGTVDAYLNRIKAEMGAMEHGNVRAVLQRLGYQKVITPEGGILWAEPAVEPRIAASVGAAAGSATVDGDGRWRGSPKEVEEVIRRVVEGVVETVVERVLDRRQAGKASQY